jgi:hypothetical protein
VQPDGGVHGEVGGEPRGRHGDRAEDADAAGRAPAPRALHPRGPGVEGEEIDEERGPIVRIAADEEGRRERAREGHGGQGLEAQPPREDLSERGGPEQHGRGLERTHEAVPQARHRAREVRRRRAAAPEQRHVAGGRAGKERPSHGDERGRETVDRAHLRDVAEALVGELSEVRGGEEHRADADAAEHRDPDEALEVAPRRLGHGLERRGRRQDGRRAGLARLGSRPLRGEGGYGPRPWPCASRAPLEGRHPSRQLLQAEEPVLDPRQPLLPRRVHRGLRLLAVANDRMLA